MSHIKLDEKLMIAKLTDKIKSCKTNNKIVNTEFLNIYKRELLQLRFVKNLCTLSSEI